MLLFVDAPKFIKVLRGSEGTEGARRTRLGVILKPAMTLRIDSNVTLSDDETTDIDAAIAQMKSADDVQRKYEAMKFPEIARHVAEYYAEQATELEKRMISLALLEAIRAIRKTDKGEPQDSATAALAPV